MQVRVVSLDDRASDLLDAAVPWNRMARFERALILARSTDGALVSVVRHDLADGPDTVRLDRSAPADLLAGVRLAGGAVRSRGMAGALA